MTQTRTFTYDGASGRILTATNPETGTVTYTYNQDGTPATKTDAKNQQAVYVYDAYRRLLQVQRYPVAGGSEDVCQRMTLGYDAGQYGQGRPTSSAWGGASCAGGQYNETYGYTQPGSMSGKSLQLTWNGNQYQALTANYNYDNEGRVLNVRYPGAYHIGGEEPEYQQGRYFVYTRDWAGRATRMQDSPNTPWDVVSGVQFGADHVAEGVQHGGGDHLSVRRIEPADCGGDHGERLGIELCV